MKQKSISSFFGAGGSSKRNGVDKDFSDKDESKPAASERVVTKPANRDVYKAEAVVKRSVKSALSVTHSFVETDTAQSLATKLDISDTVSKPNSGTNKRRVVSSDDEHDDELDEKMAKPQSKDEDSSTDPDSANESATDLEEDSEAPAIAAKSSAKTTKATMVGLVLKKSATKKAKISADIIQLAELELIDTKEGGQVPYLALCKVFETIEGTSKRLEITAYIREFLLQVMRVGQEQLTHTVMLCISKIAPDHEGIELGIGEATLIKSIATATGKQASRVKQEQQELGDLGQVVQRGKSGQRTMFKPKPLSISKVFTTFREIAMTSGSSSAQKKQSLIVGLLASCSELESRSLEGKLRIGLAESTVQTALSHAALIYEKGDKGRDDISPSDFQAATESLKQILSEFPIYSNVIESIYKHGIMSAADHCMLTPTLPVKPMLAKIEKAADDVLRRFEGKPFTCEFKYDGERSQIHFVREDDGTTKCVIFSRNAENNTNKYPDIASSVKEFALEGVSSFILDCEAVAWDKIGGKIRSFQTLSSRKRKVGNESEITVGVCCFAFDLLFLNGEPLIRHPLRHRRDLLHKHFTPVPNKFQFATAKDLTEVEDIQELLELSVQENCEGLMIKTLDGESSSYEPSKRSMNWLKLKKDYVDGLGDSLDLVVIGAYFGKGKRVGAYGSYLLACYDPDREEYQTICNIGTGFSEADLESHKAQLNQSVIAAPKPYYAASDKSKPDVWFEPTQVWEVKAADLSLSSTYLAAFGQVDANKGVSLRFPRFIRIRDDKTPEMATTSTQVAEMYENQKINQ
ncbi:ATP-dependent DNA ligase Cdc17 [Coemansia sp. RSA 2050]|nr:ATP-dependent DNA ligase Cdc17 [Coemansia sp. RSA 2050]KAJ2732703.1 ATP-dependent DNA ligase Cdc17 [Coemansia sp. BCRC 34962]